MLEPDLSARHFTTSAISIIEQLFARAADRSMGSAEITEETTTMLLLWSLVRWEYKIGLVALERVAAEPDRLARELNELLSVASLEAEADWTHQRTFAVLPCGGRAEVMDIDTPLEAVLGQAEHESLGMGHTWVGTEHLLLAIIQRASPRLRDLLGRHGVSYERAKQAVLGILTRR